MFFFSIDDYYDDPESVDCEAVSDEYQYQFAYNEGCSQDPDTTCVVGSQCGVKGLFFHVQG